MAQEKVCGFEKVVGSEAIGFLDDDGELSGETFEEGFEGGGEVVVDVGRNEIGDEGSEEDGGGGERCGSGEDGFGWW